MVPELSEWNIVLVGQWNPHILNAKWIAKELFGSTNIQIEAEMIIAPTIVGPRYSYDNLIIYPSVHRLLVGMKKGDEETLKKAEELAETTLRLLNHTPIRALGINYSFLQEDPKEEILKIFNLSDNTKLLSAGLQNNSVTEIVRKVPHLERDLNLKISLFNKSSTLKIHFNYHKDVENADTGIEGLKGHVINLYQESLRLSKDAYNLSLSPEESDGD